MMIMMKVDDDDYVMVTMMVNVCDDDCCQSLVMKVILVKEVMSCDVSPVAMFFQSAKAKHHL